MIPLARDQIGIALSDGPICCPVINTEVDVIGLRYGELGEIGAVFCDIDERFTGGKIIHIRPEFHGEAAG